ncbi:MAG: tetratricopeptide repeat protein [Deltaproteobacteria bacterium]|nr:tetratricopeptide repeat protein [Deltaproteobacteria bacterium]
MTSLPVFYFVAMVALVVYVIRSDRKYQDLRIIRLASRGHINEAIASALRKPRSARARLNDVINYSITFGHYKNALMAEAHAPPGPPPTASERTNRVLIQINLAEAEYNLGDWIAAERRLAHLDSAAEPFDICRAGLRNQRAWICANTGRASEALALLATAHVSWLPHHFRSEYWFAVAFAALGAGDYAACQKALSHATDALVRFSSKRNILFLEARLAAATGDLRRAASLCEQAANHKYKGQGADGLVLWGDVLSKLGDPAGAAHAWQLAIDRDGESEWAQVAKTRLSALQDQPVPTAAVSL